ncbi:MAG TPA: hypothetical protein VHD34_04805, partial [Xanthobacteraceae bacterium]|nr:hypothetical protein [Xanthobacteraceae bacterium]
DERVAARNRWGNPAGAAETAQISARQMAGWNFLARALAFQNIPIVFIGLLRSNIAGRISAPVLRPAIFRPCDTRATHDVTATCRL